MAFRRHNREGKEAAENARREWEAWRKTHASLIEATGLPSACFERDGWGFFMEHGYLMEGGADIRALTVRQKAALLRLIMTRPIDLREDTARILIPDLLDAVERHCEEGER